MNLGLVLNIITSALQLAPLAASTVTGIREILSRDPNVPADLQALLQGTQDDNAAALASIQRWITEHPEETGIREV